MAELIQRDDSLNQGREKLNEAIKASDRSETKADYAVETADTSISKSDSTQTQLDTIVIDGDSSVEAAQARVDEKDVVHPTLKARIDDGLNSVNQQLAQIATPINAYADLQSAIESTSDADLLFPAGIYNVSSPIKASVNGNRKWVSSGKVTFLYTGEENGIMLDVELNGNDLKIDGDFVFDCVKKARQGLQITNNVDSMEEVVDLRINKVKAKNVYSTTVGQSATGLSIRGAFSLVHLIECGVNEVSRAVGVGIPGSQGSDGITVTHYGLRAYPRQTIIDKPEIDTVTSDEVDGSPNNLDCDGIKVFAPTIDGVVVPDSIAFINGGIYKDCKGRSIKSQVSYTHVNSPTFIREKVRTITNGSEVDFQYGDGKITNYTCHYSLTEEGLSPFGSSFKIVAASSNRIDSILDVRDGTIFNNLPKTSSLPYMVIVTTAPLKEFAQINISGNKVLGVGRLGSCLRGQLNRARNVNIEENYFNDLSATLIDSMDSNGNMYNVSNNVNKGTLVIPIARASTGGAPRINGVGNIGFDDRMSAMGGDTGSQVLRTDAIMTSNGVTTGLVAMESEIIPDGATHEFSLRGGGIGLYFLATNYNENAQVLFSASSSNTKSLINNSSSAVSFGSTTNPNESGKLNVWVSDGKIMMMNRLGSNRSVTLVSIS